MIKVYFTAVSYTHLEGEAERTAHGNGGKPPAEHFGIPVVADTGVRSQEQHSNCLLYTSRRRQWERLAENPGEVKFLCRPDWSV